MARYSIEGQVLTNVADSLREKSGQPTVDVQLETIHFTETRNTQTQSGGFFTGTTVFTFLVTDAAKKVLIKNLNIVPDKTEDEIIFKIGSNNTSNQYYDIPGPEHVYNETVSLQVYECETVVAASPYRSFRVGARLGSEQHSNITINLDVTCLDANGEVVLNTIQVTRTITPENMAQEIDSLLVIPAEGFNVTGDCNSRFANNGWNWLIDNYGDKITTKDIVSLQNMFHSSNSLEEIPFDINVKNNATTFNNIFFNANGLKSIPYIIGPERTPPTSPYSGCLNLSGIFQYCYRVRYIPNDFFWKIVPNKDFWDKQATITTQSHAYIFSNCYSLRELPDISMLGGVWTSAYNNLYYNLFYYCYSLDKVENLPVLNNVNITSNYFSSTFNNCNHVKEITFETNEDGTPKTANWKNQTIDLTSNVGNANGTQSYILDYNSGITADKEAKDDATYQALKNDPDWYATLLNYSRYNHDSAVNTINSLPDCSAYGTNTIKFKGASGALTDGGAINTLTEEEIAVAAAKGWTVTLV